MSVRSTLRARLAPRTPNGADLATSTRPGETYTPKAVNPQLPVALAEPYRVDGDPVSSQAESVALDNKMWKRMVAAPRWEVAHVDAWEGRLLEERLSEGW